MANKVTIPIRAIEELITTTLAQTERELSAYKKAKAENDDRFLIRALDAEQKLSEQVTIIEAAKSAYDPYAHDGADAEIMYAILTRANATVPKKEETP